MRWKNIEIHNVAELTENPKNGGVSWLKLPKSVVEQLEKSSGKNACAISTGVELRFLIKGDSVKLRLHTECKSDALSTFHVFRGSIQGGWEDHELNRYVSNDIVDFEIKRAGKPEVLQQIARAAGQPFDSEVVRVIFDRGCYELIDVIGEVEPPRKEQLPEKTILNYGSSITHGSNALNASNSWPSLLAHNLKMDYRNLGLAGSCAMEPEVIEYLASEGEKGHWDIATLELGINALSWEEEKIISRVQNTLRQIAGRNADKRIFVISPFYSSDDYFGEGNAEKWRVLIERIVRQEAFANVTYFNGLELLGDMSLISADFVHPNLYGVQQIADRLTQRITEAMKQDA